MLNVCCSDVVKKNPDEYVECMMLGYCKKKKFPKGCFSLLMDVVRYNTCLMKIVENFEYSSELLDKPCKHGVVKKSVKLISPHGT